MIAAELFARGFDGLEAGARFETAARRISERDVLAFAELTGDHNPLHVDRERASAGEFGEPVAHGLLVVSMALGLLPTAPDGVYLRRVRDATFKRPVPVGAQIRVRGEVEQLRAIDAQSGIASVVLRVIGADDRLFAIVTIETLWRR
jgi:3-hydroxybutyryl-CoA dehydratase